MKKSMRTVLKILMAVVLISAVTILLLTAYRNYTDSGNMILLRTVDHTAVTAKLDAIGIPYGTEMTDNDRSSYIQIESRAELMPILEEICSEAGVEVTPVYREAHAKLFIAIAVSAGVIAVCCAACGIFAEKYVIKWIMFTAMFLAVAVCLTWLAGLSLVL